MHAPASSAGHISNTDTSNPGAPAQEQEPGLGILQNESQPFGRVLRNQWQVSAAGFQDAKQCYDEIQ